jgi:hypothetical protein
MSRVIISGEEWSGAERDELAARLTSLGLFTEAARCGIHGCRGRRRRSVAAISGIAGLPVRSFTSLFATADV